MAAVGGVEVVGRLSGVKSIRDKGADEEVANRTNKAAAASHRVADVGHRAVKERCKEGAPRATVRAQAPKWGANNAAVGVLSTKTNDAAVVTNAVVVSAVALTNMVAATSTVVNAVGSLAVVANNAVAVTNTVATNNAVVASAVAPTSSAAANSVAAMSSIAAVTNSIVAPTDRNVERITRGRTPTTVGATETGDDADKPESTKLSFRGIRAVRRRGPRL